MDESSKEYFIERLKAMPESITGGVFTEKKFEGIVNYSMNEYDINAGKTPVDICLKHSIEEYKEALGDTIYSKKADIPEEQTEAALD